ncbi:sensor histidine kinase [Insolitispirillum peregrinum]|uniref:sensor histidine kinase n=1 Tax=Insolitispirillum peregrinum TaxID=80876 RepID=UPI00361751BB
MPYPVIAADTHVVAGPADFQAFALLASPVWVILCQTGQILYANAAARRLWAGHDDESLCVIPEALGHDLQRSVFPACGQSLQDSLTLVKSGPGVGVQVVDCRITGLRMMPEEQPLALIEGTLRVVPDSALSWQAQDALVHTSLMVTLFGDDGQVLYQNPAARIAFGDEQQGLAAFRNRFPDSGQAVEAWTSIRMGRVFRAEIRVRTSRGARWHALEARLADGPPDSGQGVVLVTEQDITEHVQNQASLQETVERLARSNTELEQFAWITSHDLREPLRTVVSYITLLQRHLGDSLDQTGRDFMGFAVSGAKRMDALTRDLLQYASIGRSPNPRQPVNLAALMATLIAQRKDDLAACGGQVTCEPLPTVPGDLQELTLLFTNLLDNAITYRKPDQPLQVSVVAEREPHAWMVAVIDNGQGIDPRYFDRIFQIFQRLHTNDVAPGTGVGLALCRKIVERHGGRIWLESGCGRGAAFFLTLPAG